MLKRYFKYYLKRNSKIALIITACAMSFFMLLNAVDLQAYAKPCAGTAVVSVVGGSELGKIYNCVNLPIEIFKNTVAALAFGGDLGNNDADSNAAIGLFVAAKIIKKNIKKANKFFNSSLNYGSMTFIIKFIAFQGYLYLISVVFDERSLGVFRLMLLFSIILPALPRGSPVFNAINNQNNKKVSANPESVLTGLGFSVFRGGESLLPNGRAL